MKPTLPLAALLFLSACAATPIAHLSLPQPTLVSGTVTEVEKGGLTLADSTGEIDIDLGDAKIKPPIRAGEALSVRGVVDEDDSEGEATPTIEEMDAYEIIRENGDVITLVPFRR